MRKRLPAFVLCFPILSISAFVLNAQTSTGEEIRLTTDGTALQPVVVSQASSDRIRQAAKTLVDYLGRISQADVKVVSGDGVSGIAVGTAQDFPNLKLASQFDANDIMRREEYLLRSHADGLWLIGATELAVEHAVWDLLYRLGFRQFFPGDVWQVVPRERNLTLDVDAFERPDYKSRRLWYGYGMWDYNVAPHSQWCARNRCVQGIMLHTSHSYDGFVSAVRKEFDEHPEYWPLLDGERKPVDNPKPCLSNPAVRALFKKHALNVFAQNPALDSKSMDPSDRGGWCQCENCAKLGSVSDQVVGMANEVAAAVNAAHPGKLIGIHAYNYHSAPPSVRVESNVVVSVTTAFIERNFSLDEIITGWLKQGATLGIYDYYGVNVWDRDQPGHSRGGNLDYLSRSIPDYHARGARYMTAESSDNWGPNGLGYYLAARMWWDVDEAGQVDALVEDFLSRAFGPARESMREFYRQLDGSRPHPFVDDQLGRMFRSLDEGRRLADTPEVRARINQLTLYAHYCSLYHLYAVASGAERQAAFESLIRHAYRMRTTMLVHAKALYRDVTRWDKTVSIPENAGLQVAEDKNPWASSEPFEDAELAAMIAAGMTRHPLVEIEFKPAVFGTNLVPAAKSIKFPEALPEGEFGPGRGLQSFLTYVKSAPGFVELQVIGARNSNEQPGGNVKVELWRIDHSETGESSETQIASDVSVVADGAERTLKLPVQETGLYRVTVDGGMQRTSVKWPASQPMTVHSSSDSSMNDTYREWRGYFYVPKGTRTIGLFGGEHGHVRDSLGRPLFWLNARPRSSYFVPVPAQEDGKIWQVRHVRGGLRLLTVPPYFAATPDGLLLPKEIVEKDASP